LAIQHYKSDIEDIGTFFRLQTDGDAIGFRRPADGTARSVDEISLTELKALAIEMLQAGHDNESGVAAMAREIGLRKLTAVSKVRLERAWSSVVGGTSESAN
jgi:hypothetical protein